LYQRSLAPEKTIGNLLDTPIHRLMDELSVTTAQRLMHPNADPSTSSNRSSSGTEETLWVDRYRPKRFTDLLGDERVHREVLAWVKQWDLCVFGKGKGKKRARDGEGFTNSEDELGRPQEKVRILREAGFMVDNYRYYCCLDLRDWGRQHLRMSWLRRRGTMSSRSMLGMPFPC
jgi:hypothetical protein